MSMKRNISREKIRKDTKMFLEIVGKRNSQICSQKHFKQVEERFLDLV